MSIVETNKQLVAAFLGEWGKSYDAMLASFRTYLAPDCLIKMTRTPDLHGPEELIGFMHQVRAANIIETMDVELLRMVATEECVVCERIDTMHPPSGGTNAVLPTFSLMDIKDGKITEWHDYFDSADMPTGSMETIEGA